MIDEKSNALYYGETVMRSHLQKMIKEIRESDRKYNKVVGIARGGVIPAVIISHHIKLPFYCLEWSKDRPVMFDASAELDADTLLVDDIIDSGQTMVEIMEAYGKMDTATLIYNSDQQLITPTYHGWRIDRNFIPNWIDFWWEKI